MSLNAKKAKGGNASAQQEVIPVGNYPARLVQIIDLGLQAQRPYMGKDKEPIEMIRTTYELVTEFCKDDKGNDDEERPRWIGEEFPFFNLGAERAKSTQRYYGLDPQGVHDGDWSALAGAACTMTVVHNPSKDKSKVYANIGSVAPPMKGFNVPELKNPAVVWSLDDPNIEEFSKFPEFIQEKIKANLNFKGSILEARLNGQDVPAAKDEPAVEGADVENPYG